VSTRSDHDEEFLRAVGEFTVRFAELESQLRSIVGARAGTTEAVGDTLTGTMSFAQLADVYYGLCVQWVPHEQLPVRALRERLHRLNARRNAMMYYAWAPDAGPATVGRDWRVVRASDTLHWPAKDAPLPAVLHAASEAAEAFDDLMHVARPALKACADKPTAH
jgi:hypothetical protein